MPFFDFLKNPFQRATSKVNTPAHTFDFEQSEILARLEKLLPVITQHMLEESLRPKDAAGFTRGICFGLVTRFMMEKSTTSHNNGGVSRGGEDYLNWLDKLITSFENKGKKYPTDMAGYKQKQQDQYNQQLLQEVVVDLLDLHKHQEATVPAINRQQRSDDYEKRLEENGLIGASSKPGNKDAFSPMYVEYNKFMDYLKNNLEPGAKNGYINFMTEDHSMSITFETANNKKVWTFFDPNYGLRSYENFSDFKNFMDNLVIVDRNNYKWSVGKDPSNPNKYFRIIKYDATPPTGITVRQRSMQNWPAYMLRALKNDKKNFLIDGQSTGEIVDLKFAAITGTQKEDFNTVTQVTVKMTDKKEGKVFNVEIPTNLRGNFDDISHFLATNKAQILTHKSGSEITFDEHGQIANVSHPKDLVPLSPELDPHFADVNRKLIDKMSNGKERAEYSFNYSQNKDLISKLKKYLPDIGRYLLTGDKQSAKKFRNGLCVGLSSQYMIEERLNGPGGGKAYIKWLNELIDNEINGKNRKYSDDINGFRQKTHDEYNKQLLQGAIKDILEFQHAANLRSSRDQSKWPVGEQLYIEKVGANGLQDRLGRALTILPTEKSYSDFINSLQHVNKNLYIDFLSGNHSMAISVHTNNGNPIWSFYDPNFGAKAFDNYADFRSFMDAFTSNTKVKEFYDFSSKNKQIQVKLREYADGENPAADINFRRNAIANEPAFLLRAFKNSERTFAADGALAKIVDLEYGKITGTKQQDFNTVTSVTVKLIDKTNGKVVNVKIPAGAANNFDDISHFLATNKAQILAHPEGSKISFNEHGQISAVSNPNELAKDPFIHEFNEHFINPISKIFNRMANGKALPEHSLDYSQGFNLLLKLRKHIPEIGKYLVTGDKQAAKKFMKGVCVGLSTQYMMEERLNGPGGGKAYIKWLNELIDNKVNGKNRKYSNDLNGFKKKAHDEYNKQLLQGAIKEILDIQHASNQKSSEYPAVRGRAAQIYSDKLDENGLQQREGGRASIQTTKKNYSDFMNSLQNVDKNLYIDFLSNNHSMAISVHQGSAKTIWTFYDPNLGAKAFDNYADFRSFMDTFTGNIAVRKFYEFPTENNQLQVRVREYKDGAQPAADINLRRNAIANEPAFLLRALKNSEKTFDAGGTQAKVVDLEFGKKEQWYDPKEPHRPGMRTMKLVPDENRINQVTLELSRTEGSIKKIIRVIIPKDVASNFNDISALLTRHQSAIMRYEHGRHVTLGNNGEIIVKPNLKPVSDGNQKPPANHDHQIILQLENDPVVLRSAEALYNKHPGQSTYVRDKDGVLTTFSADGSQSAFDPEALKNALGEGGRLRLTLVGHGGSDGHAVTFGGRNDRAFLQYLKTILERLPKDGSLKDLNLNLVGCDLAALSPQEKKSFAERIAKELPHALKEAGFTELPEKIALHARENPVSVREDGHKIPVNGSHAQLDEVSNTVSSIRFKYDRESGTMKIHEFSLQEIIAFQKKLAVLRAKAPAESAGFSEALRVVESKTKGMLTAAVEEQVALPAEHRDPLLKQVIETGELHASGAAAWAELIKNVPEAPEGFHYRVVENSYDEASSSIKFGRYSNDPARPDMIDTHHVKTGEAHSKFMARLKQMGQSYQHFVEKINKGIAPGEAFEHTSGMNFAFIIQATVETDWKNWGKLSALDKAGSIIGMAQMAKGFAGDLSKLGSHVGELIKGPSKAMQSMGLLAKGSVVLDLAANGFFLGKGIYDWSQAKTGYKRNLAIVDTVMSGANLTMSVAGLALAGTAPWFAAATGPLIGIGFLTHALMEANERTHAGMALLENIKFAVSSQRQPDEEARDFNGEDAKPPTPGQQLIVKEGVVRIKDYAAVKEVDFNKGKIIYGDIFVPTINRETPGWGGHPIVEGKEKSVYDVFLNGTNRTFDAFKGNDQENTHTFILPSMLNGTVTGRFSGMAAWGTTLHSDALRDIENYYGREKFRQWEKAGLTIEFYTTQMFVPKQTDFIVRLNQDIKQIIIPEINTHAKFDFYSKKPIYLSPEATSENFKQLTYELFGQSGGNYNVVLPDQYERSLKIRPSKENDEHWGFQLDNRTSATRIQLRNEKLSQFLDGMGDTIHPGDLEKKVTELLLSPGQVAEWRKSRAYQDNLKSGYGWAWDDNRYFDKKDIESTFVPLFKNYVDIANQADIAASKAALIYRLDNLSVNKTNTQVFIGQQTIHFDYQMAENMHLRFKLPGMEGVSFNLTAVKPAGNETQIKFATNLALSDIKNLDGNNLKEITAFVNSHLSDTKRFTDPRFVQLHTKIGDVDVVGLIDLTTGKWQVVNTGTHNWYKLYTSDNPEGVELPYGRASVAHDGKDFVIKIDEYDYAGEFSIKPSYEIRQGKMVNPILQVAADKLFTEFMAPNKHRLHTLPLAMIKEDTVFMITTDPNDKNRPVGRFTVNAKNQSINVTQLHWESQGAVFEFNRSASDGSSTLSVTLPAGKKAFDLSALNFNSTHINSMGNLTIIVDKDTHSLTLDHKLINQLKPGQVNIVPTSSTQPLEVIMTGNRLDYRISTDGADLKLISKKRDGYDTEIVFANALGKGDIAKPLIKFADSSRPMKIDEFIQSVLKDKSSNVMQDDDIKYLTSLTRQLGYQRVAPGYQSNNGRVKSFFVRPSSADSGVELLIINTQDDKITGSEFYVNQNEFNTIEKGSSAINATINRWASISGQEIKVTTKSGAELIKKGVDSPLIRTNKLANSVLTSLPYHDVLVKADRLTQAISSYGEDASGIMPERRSDNYGRPNLNSLSLVH